MINKSLTNRIFLSAIITLFIALSSFAQEFSGPDSIPFRTDSIQFYNKIDLLPQPSRMSDLLNVGMPALPLPHPYPLPDFSSVFKPGYYPDFHPDRSPFTKGEYNVSGVIKDFRNGAIYGMGRQQQYAGLGAVNDASVGYVHSFNDRLSIDLQLYAIKTSIPAFRSQSFGSTGSISYQLSDRITLDGSMNLYTLHSAIPAFNSQSFGSSGRISYQLNDRVSLNAFGSYSTLLNAPFKSYEYGGTINVKATERFGTEVGVRRHYNSMTGQWETTPIVIPYYNFDKFTLGADVGGILMHLLRNAVQVKPGYGNPTIGPPIP